MIPKVKICGIVTLDDALVACDAGANALGFNFASEARKRNRYIDPEAAQIIVEQLPPFVSSVAITVNEDPGRVREYLEFVDYVQLHGEEAPASYADFARRVIKAFRVGPDFPAAFVLAHPARAWLLDAYVPGKHGGTGATCDWATARHITTLGRPVFLAGGLTPDNVAEAIRTVRPYGVDTAGGVESAPGKKDHDRIRAFIRNAKSALSLSG